MAKVQRNNPAAELAAITPGVGAARKLAARSAAGTLAQYAVAGLIIAVIAWNTRRRWAWWVYPLLVLAAVFVLGAILQTGQRASG